MRLYAYLLLAGLAVSARAASIATPDNVQTEKKLPEVEIPDNKENVDSDQELVDPANTVKDVENNLRVKPIEGIPVAVFVENVQPSLKASEEKEEEIDRPEPDLKHPGPPQRQLHETQNPEYHDPEQQSVLNFRENVNDAQIILRQGFQGVSDGIQHIYDSNDKLKNVQQTIKSLQDGFTSQINKLNNTVRHFFNSENPASVRSAETEVQFQTIESGLKTLKKDFNAGVKTLAQGVDVVASLRAENENTDGSTSPGSPDVTVPANVIYEYLQVFQQTLTSGFNNVTQAINGYLVQNQANKEPSGSGKPPGNVQADSPAPAQPSGPFGWLNNIGNAANFFNSSGSGPFQSIAQNFQLPFFNQNNQNSSNNHQQDSGSQSPSLPAPIQTFIDNIGSIGSNINNFWQGSTTSASPTESQNKPTESGSKPEEASTSKPQDSSGPIKKLLQNNPIAQAVKRVQESTVVHQKLADGIKSLSEDVQVEEQKVEVAKIEKVKTDEEKITEEKVDELVVENVENEKVEEGSSKGGYYGGYGGTGAGTNNNSGGLEQNNEIVNVEKEKLPEEPQKLEVQEEKQEESLKKTE